jgi:hypothetical protein
MVLSPADTGIAHSLVALAPGAYRIAIHAPADRPSQKPYKIQLEQTPDASGMPVLGAQEPAPPPAATSPTTPRP